MISAELTSELRERFSPDGSDLRRQQIIMLEMLKKFNTFCNENGIVYWLSSGTLLGAVRHQGFIPWDDDLDIEMFKDEFRKLLRIRKKLTLETGLILQDHKSDREYIAPYPKLRDTSSELHEIHFNDTYYKYRGIYIDIFLRDRSSKPTTFVSHGLQYYSYKFTRLNNDLLRKNLKRIFWGGMHYAIFPILNLLDIVFYRSDKYRHIKGSGFYDHITEKMIFPLKQIRFENYSFPVPNDTDTYLRIQYGDYMQLPSFENLRIHYGKIFFNINEKSNR